MIHIKKKIERELSLATCKEERVFLAICILKVYRVKMTTEEKLIHSISLKHNLYTITHTMGATYQLWKMLRS